jgi:sensor histidine kinase YesM
LKKVPVISIYWKCQIIGWLLASLYWGYSAFNAYFDLLLGAADFTGDILVGILLTHAYRNFARSRNWHQLSLKALLPRSILAIIILSLLFMVAIILKLYAARLLFYKGFDVPFETFFASGWLTVFITGTRLMSIWVLAYHLYHYAQREINTAKENARLAVIAKEAQLNNLSAQLNPHFFFNSLGNIKFLVDENPASARRAIDLLADLLRDALYSNSDRLIPLQEELGFVTDYLELQKLRFEERMQVNINAATSLKTIRVPRFSIQALVENAVKHGIEQSKAGGTINVVAVQEDDCLKISVSNPGTLNGTLPVTGLGLKNLAERLQLQYNGRASVSITAVTGETVLATMIIPVA